MSPVWSSKRALAAMLQLPESQIGDVLLDQEIFAGLGNIIKNEVLFLVKMLPTRFIKTIKNNELKKIVKTARNFSFQFFEWRKLFELKKHYQIYRQSTCPHCQGKVTKKWTGLRNRVSFFCENCQH